MLTIFIIALMILAIITLIFTIIFIESNTSLNVPFTIIIYTIVLIIITLSAIDAMPKLLVRFNQGKYINGEIHVKKDIVPFYEHIRGATKVDSTKTY